VVDLSISGDKLRLKVKGLDRLWAMRSRLDVPLASVRAVRFDPAVARGLWKGVSAPGTHIPGVIVAGTFYKDDKRIFWDVHDPGRTVVIDLVGQRYDQIIVEVRDPETVVKMLEDAIADGMSGGGSLGPAAAARNG